MRSRMIWRGANKYDFSFRNLSFGKKSIALKNVCILSVVINYYNEVLFLETPNMPITDQFGIFEVVFMPGLRLIESAFQKNNRIYLFSVFSSAGPSLLCGLFSSCCE